MSAIVLPLIVLAVAGVVSLAAYLRRREPVGAGIDDFRREMQAVAPRSGGRGSVPPGKH